MERYAKIDLSKKLLSDLKYYEKNNKIEWRDIKWYEGVYQISNIGLVKSLSRDRDNWKWWVYKTKEKILALTIDRWWYVNISLCKNKIVKKIWVHRLVWIHFIKNKYNKKEINHINWDKLNNNVLNLEWCTASENIRHRFDKLWYKSRMQIDWWPSKWKFGKQNHKSKKVKQLDLRWYKIADTGNKQWKNTLYIRPTILNSLWSRITLNDKEWW